MLLKKVSGHRYSNIKWESQTFQKSLLNSYAVFNVYYIVRMSGVTEEQRQKVENVVNDSLDIINNARQRASDVLKQPTVLEQGNLNAKLIEHLLNKLANNPLDLERDIKWKSDQYCSRIYNSLICIAIGVMLILMGLIVVFMIEPALLGAKNDFKTIVRVVMSNCTCN